MASPVLRERSRSWGNRPGQEVRKVVVGTQQDGAQRMIGKGGQQS